jgi:hypothetical protein
MAAQPFGNDFDQGGEPALDGNEVAAQPLRRFALGGGEPRSGILI